MMKRILQMDQSQRNNKYLTLIIIGTEKYIFGKESCRISTVLIGDFLFFFKYQLMNLAEK